MLRKEYAMNGIREGIYRHHKGNLYRVLCVAMHSETLEVMVVYQDAINEEKFWARPPAMWNKEVDVGGEKLPRFQFLAPSMEVLDQNPMFRIIEAIKDNLEQYQHLGEYNTLFDKRSCLTDNRGKERGEKHERADNGQGFGDEGGAEAAERAGDGGGSGERF